MFQQICNQFHPCLFEIVYVRLFVISQFYLTNAGALLSKAGDKHCLVVAQGNCDYEEKTVFL